MRILPWVIAAAACGGPPSSPIRDVSPQKIERGLAIAVEAHGLVPGAPTTIELSGSFARPTGAAAATVTLPARAITTERAIAIADADVEKRVGRADFSGTLTVVQTQDGQERRLTSGKAPIELQFFPPTLQRLADTLVSGRRASRVLGWLGLKLSHDASGVFVADAADEFAGEEFVHEHDRVPLDGRITKAELGAEWARYAVLDDNHDGAITRLEAEHHTRKAGIAARAGVATGDRITQVNGKPLADESAFSAAWDADVPSVELDLARASGPAHATLPREGLGPDIPAGLLMAGIPIAAALLLIALLGPFGGLIVVAERRISAQMQSRIGPNRVGPQGLLQWLADGLKLITKEDVVPTESDPILFKLSPYLVWMGIFGTFVVLPFSQSLIVADMNIGLLYLLSITALVVVGIIMGGWASNSKWSLLGGMRSAAQIISYEIPASIALLSVVLLAGTLSPQGIIRAQGGAPWNWNLFDNPFTFGAFFIYFISALAEGNRTPFDLPEAESELVSGYNTEYSGFRFSVFFLGEWVNLYVISAVATTVFLGGWRVPHVPAVMMESGRVPPLIIAIFALATGALPIGYWYLSRRYRLPSALIAGLVLAALGGGLAAIGWQAVGFMLFFGKALALVFVIIWVRWTVPRFRVDQMMAMCWKYFIPLSFVCFVGVAAWSMAPAVARTAMRWAMFLVAGVGTTAYFLSRVRKNLQVARTRVWDAFAVK